MGLEARCAIEWRSKKQTAALHLDSQHLDVRIKPALRIAFSSITSLRVEGDRLLLEWPDGRLALQLGARDAAKWASKIASPKSRLSKLGVKADQRVCLIDCDDDAFIHELARGGIVSITKLARGLDLVLLFVSEPTALAKLTPIKRALAENGAVWVVRDKGKSSLVSEGDVRARARETGLVDVKVMSFTETRSALKFVIPRSQRAAR